MSATRRGWRYPSSAWAWCQVRRQPAECRSAWARCAPPRSCCWAIPSPAQAVELGLANAVLPASGWSARPGAWPKRFNRLPPGAVRDTQAPDARTIARTTARGHRHRAELFAASCQPGGAWRPSDLLPEAPAGLLPLRLRPDRPMPMLALARILLAPLLLWQGGRCNARCRSCRRRASATPGLIGSPPAMQAPRLRLLIVGNSSGAAWAPTPRTGAGRPACAGAGQRLQAPMAWRLVAGPALDHARPPRHCARWPLRGGCRLRT